MMADGVLPAPRWRQRSTLFSVCVCVCVCVCRCGRTRLHPTEVVASWLGCEVQCSCMCVCARADLRAACFDGVVIFQQADGVEMNQADDGFDRRHRPANGFDEEEMANHNPHRLAGNQGIDIEEEEETGGGGGALPEHEQVNPHQANVCGSHYGKPACINDHRCHWSHNTCSYHNDHRVHGDHGDAGRHSAENDAAPKFQEFEQEDRPDILANQHGVRPHAAPRHNSPGHVDYDDVDDGSHAEISSNRKHAKGDALFFTFGIIAVLLLIAAAFVSACSSKTIVLGAGCVDFWTAAAFYWVDVRLPYNIDHYEHGGLNYDAFAITCIMVVIFAIARVGSAYTSIKAADVGGPKRPEFWSRIDVLAMMGLIAQLVVLCIHVITTKHASRTVVCAFIGTITSAVVQAWHLIQDAKSNLGKQT